MGQGESTAQGDTCGASSSLRAADAAAAQASANQRLQTSAPASAAYGELGRQGQSAAHSTKAGAVDEQLKQRQLKDILVAEAGLLKAEDAVVNNSSEWEKPLF
eukprot:TRINITY_DN8730_c0_g1_i1.p1 TRINITY_DN8730_c0_g1~~TRINITY_DN8730_c0_g1_i1.p1  ORF type:complete len:103 (-),score=32.79 TRINITY_DN8730_c0_g1_i1:247-555(-)